MVAVQFGALALYGAPRAEHPDFAALAQVPPYARLPCCDRDASSPRAGTVAPRACPTVPARSLRRLDPQLIRWSPPARCATVLARLTAVPPHSATPPAGYAAVLSLCPPSPSSYRPVRSSRRPLGACCPYRRCPALPLAALRPPPAHTAMRPATRPLVAPLSAPPSRTLVMRRPARLLRYPSCPICSFACSSCFTRHRSHNV
ncbi:hypothetical protein B0H11DRAFT_2351189 [Mycena galericulata]|nr:hypothetical protein B0H11DRAFT_2351189 [Mycena galericulata]